jgi:hypothetical protein
VQELPAVAGQREDVRSLVGEGDAALDQRQRSLRAVRRRLGARCLQIGSGRSGVLRPVQVLGVEHRIAPGELPPRADAAPAADS